MYYYVILNWGFSKGPLIIHANNRVEIYTILEEKLHNTGYAMFAKRYNTYQQARNSFRLDDEFEDFIKFWDFDVQSILMRLHFKTTRHDNIYYL